MPPLDVVPKVQSVSEDHIPASRPSDSSKDASFIRQAEKVTSKAPEALFPGKASEKTSEKLSTKIVTYLSSKLNAVLPAIDDMEEGHLREFEQLAVVAAESELGEPIVEALEERYGSEMSAV